MWHHGFFPTAATDIAVAMIWGLVCAIETVYCAVRWANKEVFRDAEENTITHNVSRLADTLTFLRQPWTMLTA